MNQHEFTALQVVVLVRTQPGESQDVQAFFDSAPLQYELQDTLAGLLEAQLKQASIDFEEVIIAMDAPAKKAQTVQKKQSLMSRLFGSR